MTSCVLAALGISGAIWLHAQQIDTRSLASLFPPGALLYLEAKDFHALLNAWNASSEKKSWLASANFGILSRSRLVGRLAEAQTQFESVAGVPVALNLADQSAGHQSAFAFYDLAALTFLYLTKVDASLLDANELWRARSQYQMRQVAGINFFVRTDAATKRSACFASYKGWFLIATGENQMAAALTLLSGAPASSLGTESWFARANALSSSQGDLRLVYNLEKLLATPQFRTYWIQRNASELKPFAAGISDLSLRAGLWEEQRALLKQSPSSAVQPSGSLATVTRYAAPTASLYRAWDSPDKATLSSVVQQVIFGEAAQVENLDRYAPAVSADVPAVGSVTDLETRIDEPVSTRDRHESLEPLISALSAMQPVALAHIQTTIDVPGNVFVLPQSGVVLECVHPQRAALDTALAAMTTISQTGTLDPLRISVSDRIIVLSRLDLAPVSGSTIDRQVTYAAAYSHASEWPYYRKLFDLIDRRPISSEMQAPQAEPPFFSGNLRSLGDTISGLQRASISSRDEGPQLRETVRYEVAMP
jgi:hypothetical protein